MDANLEHNVVAAVTSIAVTNVAHEEQVDKCNIIERLPAEIKMQIMTMVGAHHVRNLALSCKTFHAIFANSQHNMGIDLILNDYSARRAHIMIIHYMVRAEKILPDDLLVSAKDFGKHVEAFLTKDLDHKKGLPTPHPKVSYRTACQIVSVSNTVAFEARSSPNDRRSAVTIPRDVIMEGMYLIDMSNKLHADRRLYGGYFGKERIELLNTLMIFWANKPSMNVQRADLNIRSIKVFTSSYLMFVGWAKRSDATF